MSTIWSTMYQCITQSNYILESLATNRDEIKYAEIIEGETYALRAFVHMELASMFGPVIKTAADLDKPCIAYRTAYNIVAQEFESTRSVLNKAKIDLQKALVLLENDPIIENRRYGDGNASMLDYHSVLERRGDRMNLFAVKALLIRVELALLEKDQAGKMAADLIAECNENELFVLTQKEDNLYNKNLCQETLLCFYKNALWSVTKVLCCFEAGSSNSNLCITPAQDTIYINDLYAREPDGSGTDNRLRYWFTKTSN